MPGASPLPEFVEPMLAKLGKQPFDSDEHLFEIKWDGTRVLAFVEGGDYRLTNRRRNDVKLKYPELSFLKGLEPGTVLDGEVVMFKDERPDFESMLRREQATTERAAKALAREIPAVYVAFDVLYRDFEPCMDRPLAERRELLSEVVSAAGESRLVLSDGVVGAGRALFEEIGRQGMEGIVAKRLDGRYLPGRRTDSWTKLKTFQRMLCAIVGYQLDEDGGLRSVIVAADSEDGEGLRCVGKVGSGLAGKVREDLFQQLRSRPCDEPIVACDVEGEWVEPGLYCTVSFLERTSTGNLRAPVFLELHVDPG